MEKDPEKRFTCDQALEHPWWDSTTDTQPDNHQEAHISVRLQATWCKLPGLYICHGEQILPLSSVTMALSREPTSAHHGQPSEKDPLNKWLPISGWRPEGPLKNVEALMNN